MDKKKRKSEEKEKEIIQKRRVIKQNWNQKLQKINEKIKLIYQ